MKKSRTLFAIDVGTQYVGWAIGSADERPRFGTFRLPSVAQDDLGTLLVSMRTFLYGKAPATFDAIVYESPILVARNDPYTIRKKYALEGLIELVAHDVGTECFEAAIGAVRKHFLGKGYPNKTEEAKRAIMARCRALGWACETSHEGDALAILSYSMSVRGHFYDGDLLASG